MLLSEGIGTSDPDKLRLIDTDLADPALTAAIDESLLESVASGGGPALHLYRRRPPGVTLGYFLKASENVDLDYCKAEGIKVIRRLSGGGAIYTDGGQLVYGLAVQDVLPLAPAKCFEVVCGALVNAVRRIGLGAVFSPVNDVLVNGKKVSGSAIVNRGRTKLVHGTVIVRLDRGTMFRALRVPDEKLRKKALSRPGERVTSLEEALDAKVQMRKVKDAVAREIAKSIDLTARKSELTKKERARVDELVRIRYGTDAWNYKR